MPIEIEAKVSVPEVDVVRKRLQEVGAEPAGSVVETNTFFDTDDRSLLAADKGLRLRKKVNASDKTDVKYIITFKGPRRHGQLKSREEVELVVEAEREAMSLLACLGYSRILSFEKRRESWKLGGCSVELDELPHLGTYVEIEGPNEGAINKVRDQLHLTDRPLVKASYVALLMTHLQERGDTKRAITFQSTAS